MSFLAPNQQCQSAEGDTCLPENGHSNDWCICEKDADVGTNARELFDKHVNDLSSETCQKLVLKTICKIDGMFRDLLRPKVDDGVRQAVSTANTTVEKWGSKVRVVFGSVQLQVRQ